MAANDPLDGQRLSGVPVDNAEDAMAQWFPFVKRLAQQTYKVAPRGELLDDLEGDGFEALVRALDSFDPTRGVPPEGWIALKVRGAMIDGLRRRYPGPYRRRRQRERLGSVEFVSLDTPVGGAEAGLTLEETLTDIAAIPVEEQVEEREHLAAKRNRLRSALEKLSKREKRILLLRHVKEMSVAEVAACEGVTEDRVYKIECVARVKAGGEDPSAASSSDPSRLSKSELTVLQSAAAGDTILETAKRLRRSSETVKQHRSAVIRKLGARNMYHALSKAYQVGILQ